MALSSQKDNEKKPSLKVLDGTKASNGTIRKATAEEAKKLTKRTIYDYWELIETVARVEASRLPRHLIDYSEIVNIGAMALHTMFEANPEREYNVTYLSTAIKWAVRNELRYRYKWYSHKQTEVKEDEGDGVIGDGLSSKSQTREAVYGTILSVDSMMEAENPHEVRDEGHTPDEMSELKEMARIVRECIARLPQRDREIVEARFFQNLKMREIGEIFGISPSRTSRVVQGALDKVKKELVRRGLAADVC